MNDSKKYKKSNESQNYILDQIHKQKKLDEYMKKNKIVGKVSILRQFALRNKLHM